MTHISVSMYPATAQRRLDPSYDEEADVLSLSSTNAAPRAQGIDIDGTIIFDLDAHGYLLNVDILVPRALWQVGSVLVPPTAAPAGDLQLAAATIAQKSFNLPKLFRTNPGRTKLDIYLGRLPAQRTWIMLSQHCWALVDQLQLVGLIVSRIDTPR